MARRLQCFSFDTSSLRRAVKRLESEADKLSERVIKEATKELLKMAKDRAPEKSGDYMRDHKMEMINTKEGPTGVVYVDPNGKSKDYQMIVHEVPRNPGKKSREKQNKLGVVVGYKNLERAWVEGRTKLKDMIIKGTLKELLKAWGGGR